MAFKAEGRDMTFDGVTEGLNKQGVEDYLDFLQVKVIEKIIEELGNVDDVNAKINAGWQGQSRDAFLEKFNKTIEATQTELRNEFNNLVAKIDSLATSYYEQDAKMMDI